jgi:hypothetical protein
VLHLTYPRPYIIPATSGRKFAARLMRRLDLKIMLGPGSSLKMKHVDVNIFTANYNCIGPEAGVLAINHAPISTKKEMVAATQNLLEHRACSFPRAGRFLLVPSDCVPAMHVLSMFCVLSAKHVLDIQSGSAAHVLQHCFLCLIPRQTAPCDSKADKYWPSLHKILFPWLLPLSGVYVSWMLANLFAHGRR